VEVEIAARHVEVTEPIKRHIQQQIDKLPRFAELIRHLTVKLVVDSGSHFVEILARCRRADLVAEARAHDMYQSIDQAFAKVERRLARHHDKLVNNRARDAQRDPQADRRAE
jgi:ribosomal subunit interface protein